MKTIELIDSLPGSGKSTAIFKYMAEDRSRPWLYLSPMKEEIDERVDNESEKHNMQFYIPKEGTDATKTEQVLDFLEEGYDVACTHNLMLRFTKAHIKAIKKEGYNVVCDETLDLLSGYNMVKDDHQFLLDHKLITVDSESGRVSFSDVEMGSKAKYADVKLLCDIGCLFAAKRSNRMLVTQLSTDLLKEANRFILITYNYKDSIMDAFLRLHGFDWKPLDNIKLYRSSEEIKKNLQNIIQLLETPSVKAVQKNFNLTKSWWTTASTIHKDKVINTIASVKSKEKVKSSDLFFTLPKFITEKATAKSYQMSGKSVSRDSWLACNTRATNNYAHKSIAVHAYNLYPNVAVKSYLQDMGVVCNDDTYALNMLIQWLFRGCIRNEEFMKVALLSNRMSVLFKDWFMSVDIK